VIPGGHAEDLLLYGLEPFNDLIPLVLRRADLFVDVPLGRSQRRLAKVAIQDNETIGLLRDILKVVVPAFDIGVGVAVV
jgi:hypothetical protein